jgi:mRNA interferase MazF
MIRGEIWWADFGIPFGSESGFKRPVLIVQSDDFNKSKINTVIVIPFSTNLTLEFAPGNILYEKEITKLSKDSVLVVSQINSIDKQRLIEKISKISNSLISQIEDGILLVLGINKYSKQRVQADSPMS